MSVIWAGGRTSPPSDKPRCGWDNELCLEEEKKGEIVTSTPEKFKLPSRDTLPDDSDTERLEKAWNAFFNERVTSVKSGSAPLRQDIL